MFCRFGPVSFLSVVALAVLLCGCGGGPEQTALTPMPAQEAGPGDAALKAALRIYFQKAGAPAYTQYEYGRFDLNNDGAQDALVYLKGPYGYWCGDEGCTLLVLRAAGDGFVPVSTIRRVRNPIHVSLTEHRGWHDLAVRVAAGPEKAEYVRLFYNGRGYDDPPSMAGQGALFHPGMNAQRFFP